MKKTPGFLVLGNNEFKVSVAQGLESKKLSIQQKITKTANQEAVGKMVVEGKELDGCVWLTPNEDTPFFIAVDQKDPKTTDCLWQFREEKYVFGFNFDKSKDALSEYEKFVALMSQFERFLHEKIGASKDGILIPVEFYGILEFEYFRQIREFCEKVELAIAIPDCPLESKAILAMCRVFASDGDQIFYGVVECQNDC